MSPTAAVFMLGHRVEASGSSSTAEIVDTPTSNKMVPYAGDCFTFHGSAEIWNGNPSLRILRIGTKRIIGISDSCVDWPAGIFDATRGIGTRAFGEFTVCPLTKSKPGAMQFACLRAYRITRIERAKMKGK